MSVTTKLIIGMVAMFAFQCIDEVYMRGGISKFLVLTTTGLKRGYIWQLFTFQVMHAGVFHLFFNCLILYFIGTTVERTIGAYRYLVLFFGSGLIGGVLQSVLMLAMPTMYGSALVGASAGVGGIFAVMAMLYRGQTVLLFAIVPVKAEKLLWAFLGIALFFTMVPAGGNVAHAAHLGGLLAGIFFVKRGWHQDFRPFPWDGLLERFKGRGPRRPFVQRVKKAPVRRQPSPAPSAEENPDFIASQVDPILDKISEKGLHSLTDKEREILEKARKNMGRG